MAAAEDIMVDDQVETGDPEPVLKEQDRVRLDGIVRQMVKNKESDKAIQAVVNDFKKRYIVPATPKQASALPKLDFTKPVYQENVSESTAAPQTNVEAALAVKPTGTLADKYENKIKASRDNVFKELTTNDKAIENLVRKQRFEQAGRNVELPTSDMPVQGALAQQVAQNVQQEPEAPITEQEIAEKKTQVATDDSHARRMLEEVARINPEKNNLIQKSIYDLDVANSIQNDPNGTMRVKKVMDNSKKLENGELVYDFRSGHLYKPENIVQSFLTGWKEKNKAFDDTEFLRNTQNNGAIAMQLNADRNNFDPDAPIPIPEGKLGMLGAMIGGTPAKALVGGAIASLAGPEAGVAAGSIIGGREMSKMEYGNTFKRVYYELTDKGVDENEAVDIARKQANEAAEVGMVTGMAMGLIGGRVGMKPLPKIALTEEFRKAALSALKGAGTTLSTATKEGLLAGGIAAGGETYKNSLAQDAGINRPIDAGVAEQIESNLLFTLGMAAVAKGAKAFSPKTYKSILSGLSKADEGYVGKTLNDMVENGVVTEQQAGKAMEDIAAFKKEDSVIPSNIDSEARLQIQDKLKKRDALEAEMETTHKAFHPQIKEKIKAIDEEVAALSEQKVKADPEEKKIHTLLADAVEEGKLQGMMGDIAKSDPQGFMKFVADKALSRTDTGKMSSIPDAEYAIREQVGDAIVDKALEMFPLEKKPESKISVIRPEERTQPTETITIKPEDHAQAIRGDKSEIPEGGNVGGQRSDARSENIQLPEIERSFNGETEQQTGANEENKNPGEGPQMIGITHAQMDSVARELGFDTYEKDPETIALWDKQARERFAKDPDAINKLVNKLRSGEGPDKVETRMMIMHIADLKAKYDKAPTPEKLNEIKRVSDLYDISGREKGKELVARKGSVPVEENLSDFHLRDIEYNKNAPLTEEQLKTSTKEHEEISTAKAALDEKVAKLEAENARLKAEKQIKKEASTVKKDSKKDYKTERKQIVEDIREKLKKARGESSVVAVPYAKELIAIAPDVAKLVRSLVEEGIEKLPEVIKAVHNQLKEFIPEITEKDVHNIIAGEYNTKPTKNDLSEKLFNLKLHAKLINKLEALEAGVQPKNEKQRIKRSQDIEELRAKIRELTKHEPTDAEKLQALKSRIKGNINKIEEQLKSGDFTEAKPEPIKLDKEAQELKDKYNKLKSEREVRLFKQKYAQRGKIEKLGNAIANILNVPRSIMSSMDFSAPFRQGLVATVSHPVTASKAFAKMFEFAFSQKRYDRWFNELKESPEYNTMVESGLALSDPHDPLLAAKEEAFMSNLAQKIPVAGKLIKGSERAYTGYLNKLRADAFTQITNAYKEDGKTFENSKELYEQTAKYVNATTGRGDLGKTLNNAAPVLNGLFFSPRLIASRIQLLSNWANPLFYKNVPKEVRVQYFKDMAKFIAAGTTILALAKASGAEVEDDPRSTDFGKIKSGNTRWDIWGGFQQYVRLFSQLFSGEKVSGDKVTELDGKGAFGETRGDVLSRFGRSKLAPVPGLAVDLLEGRKVTGEKILYQWGGEHGDKEITMKDIAASNLLPLIYSDVKGAMQDQGIKALFTVGIPAAFGVGTSTYNKAPASPKKGGKSSNKKSNKVNNKTSNK